MYYQSVSTLILPYNYYRRFQFIEFSIHIQTPNPNFRQFWNSKYTLIFWIVIEHNWIFFKFQTTHIENGNRRFCRVVDAKGDTITLFPCENKLRERKELFGVLDYCMNGFYSHGKAFVRSHSHQRLQIIIYHLLILMHRLNNRIQRKWEW